MRISDWSSDVCSSDLLWANALSRVDHVVMGTTGNVFAVAGRLDDPAHKRAFVSVEEAIRTPVEQSDEKLYIANQAITQERVLARQQEIGRASCRDRVCQYV